MSHFVQRTVKKLYHDSKVNTFFFFFIGRTWVKDEAKKWFTPIIIYFFSIPAAIDPAPCTSTTVLNKPDFQNFQEEHFTPHHRRGFKRKKQTNKQKPDLVNQESKCEYNVLSAWCHLFFHLFSASDRCDHRSIILIKAIALTVN